MKFRTESLQNLVDGSGLNKLCFPEPSRLPESSVMSHTFAEVNWRHRVGQSSAPVFIRHYLKYVRDGPILDLSTIESPLVLSQGMNASFGFR